MLASGVIAQLGDRERDEAAAGYKHAAGGEHGLYPRKIDDLS